MSIKKDAADGHFIYEGYALEAANIVSSYFNVRYAVYIGLLNMFSGAILYAFWFIKSGTLGHLFI